MSKLKTQRGLIVAACGIGLLILGSNIFDSSYNVVENLMSSKQYLIRDKTLQQGESVNSTIGWNTLFDHSILIVNVLPQSGTVKLSVSEPGGGTFEKDSTNGYVYHIIGKSPRNQGDYDFRVSNLGIEPTRISVVLGEDPYLSGKCNAGDQMSCYEIPMAIGIVIAGMLSLIAGSLIAVNDFRKKKKAAT